MSPLVYPVFRQGLRLKERMSLGGSNLDKELAELKDLIKIAETASPPDAQGESNERYLGIGYPLACWVDELIFLAPDSPWKVEWIDRRLVLALYRCKYRGSWEFWQQAQLAEARGDETALKVFYLCLMLGFRGDLRDAPPELLGAWRMRLESRLPSQQAYAWPDKPIEKPIPPPDVPPLRARERLSWLFLASGLVLAGTIIALGYTALRGIGN